MPSRKQQKLVLIESSLVKFHILVSFLAKNKVRRWSIHPVNKNRQRNGEFYRLYQKLREHPEKFHQYFRMKIGTFDSILELVRPKIKIRWSNFIQNPISVEERLVVAIRFLATGRSFRDLSLTFKLGLTTTIKIVKSMVTLIWECLQPIHMKCPTSEDFLRIANDFYNIWNFPNTIGTIDGKHIRLKCPSNSGTMYYNKYKHFFSIVLQAVTDAHGRFIIVEIGGYGKQSDDGIFHSSRIFELMEKGNLNIPTDSPLPGTSTPMPFVFIGDEAYPLLRHLLRPYSRKNLDPQTEYFNSRFSRARRIVECAFGIMNAKWRILQKPIETLPAFADSIVKCICVLHNAIIDLEGNESLKMFNEHEIVQESETSATGRNNNRASGDAIDERNIFKAFLWRNKI